LVTVYEQIIPRTVWAALGLRTGAAGRGGGGRVWPPLPPPFWRHSYATSLLCHGEDIDIAQRLLGHSNIATAVRYLHLSDQDLKDAVDGAFPAE
jgi:site-specific recombinase XerD